MTANNYSDKLASQPSPASSNLLNLSYPYIHYIFPQYILPDKLDKTSMTNRVHQYHLQIGTYNNTRL